MQWESLLYWSDLRRHVGGSDLSTKQRWVVSILLLQLKPPPPKKTQGTDTSYPPDWRLVGPRIPYGHCAEEKNLALPGIKPRSSSLKTVTTPSYQSHLQHTVYSTRIIGLTFSSFLLLSASCVSCGPANCRTFENTPSRAKWSKKISWALVMRSWMICSTTKWPSSSSCHQMRTECHNPHCNTLPLTHSTKPSNSLICGLITGTISITEGI
jgi:hypothetical protein